MHIQKASKILRLNISTSKLILDKYKETGQFFMKEMFKTKPRNMQYGKEKSSTGRFKVK